MSTRNPQRKRCGGTVNSRQTQKRTQETTSTPEISLEAEPIELVETVGDEIVDLSCESLEPVVVDLTHNDSVVIVEERRRPRRNGRRLRQDHADSCVVSSDDEELSRDKDVYVTTHTPRSTKDDGARVLLAVRAAWMDTLRLCRMGVSLFLQDVAMSSVASASVIPLRMLTLAQLVGKRSTINDTTPFIYEMFTTAQDRPMDRQPGWLFCMVAASSFLSSKRLSKINV